MKKRLILPLIFCALSSSAMAQTTAIDEMFEVMSMERQMAGGFEAMLPLIDKLSTQLKLNSEEEQELKGIFRTWYNEDIDRAKIMSEVKKLYAGVFTDSEIRDIIKFYQTPTGQKFLEKSPEIMKLRAQIGMQEGQNKQFKLSERLQPFFEKHKTK